MCFVSAMSPFLPIMRKVFSRVPGFIERCCPLQATMPPSARYGFMRSLAGMAARPLLHQGGHGLGQPLSGHRRCRAPSQGQSFLIDGEAVIVPAASDR